MDSSLDMTVVTAGVGDKTLGAGRKVFIVCGAGIISGKELIALILGRGLRDQGWDPEFVTSTWGDRDYVQRLTTAGFATSRMRLGFFSLSLNWRILKMTLYQLVFWPSLLLSYFRGLCRVRPAAAIHTSWQHALLLLPLLNSRRDIFWVHDIARGGPMEARALRWIGARVARVICVSAAVAAAMKAIGISEAKIAVIYNGVAVGNAPERAVVQGTLRLGIVGQIAEWKGHDDLLEAVAILARRGLPIVLEIFGKDSSPYSRDLRRRSAELGIAAIVRWRGFVASQAEIYRSIDVCVVPSRSAEPLATSALEAGAFGKPVVCSARGGLPEIVEDGLTGFVVAPQSPEKLAQAIENFLSDPGLLVVMGDAAQRRIREKFLDTRFAEEFGRAIEQTCRARLPNLPTLG
jgi:glycosyltransferase involved in cell wall biosynthesis